MQFNEFCQIISRLYKHNRLAQCSYQHLMYLCDTQFDISYFYGMCNTMNQVYGIFNSKYNITQNTPLNILRKKLYAPYVQLFENLFMELCCNSYAEGVPLYKMILKKTETKFGIPPHIDPTEVLRYAFQTQIPKDINVGFYWIYEIANQYGYIVYDNHRFTANDLSIIFSNFKSLRCIKANKYYIHTCVLGRLEQASVKDKLLIKLYKLKSFFK